MRDLFNIGGGGAGNLGTLFVRISTDASRLFKGLTLAERRIGGFAVFATKMIGGTVAGAFSSLSAAAGVALREYAQFNSEMTKSLAIMGEVTDETREKLERLAKELAETTDKTADQLAQAYYYLASAGLSAEKSLKVLPTVTKFATAGVMNLAEATSLLVDATSALGLSSDDATQYMENMAHVADVLAKASTLANATITQFAQALANKAAAGARMVGMSLEEATAALAAFANKGIKGLIAGERLYIVIRELQRAALQNRKAFEELGVQVYDTQGEMRPLADILEDLENLFQGLSDQERKAALQFLGFQEEASASMLILLGSSETIKKFTEELKNSGGAVEEMAKKQLTSLRSQFTMTLHTIENLLIDLGEILAPAFEKVLKKIRESVKEGSAFRTKLEEIFRYLSAHAGAFLKIAKATLSGVRLIWENLIINPIKTAVESLSAGVGAVLFLVGKGFSLIIKGVSASIDFLVDKLNWMIDQVNKLTGKLGESLKIPKIELPTTPIREWVDTLAEGGKIMIEKSARNLDEWMGKLVDHNEAFLKAVKEAHDEWVRASAKTAEKVTEAVETQTKAASEAVVTTTKETTDKVTEVSEERIQKVKKIIHRYLEGLEKETKTVLDKIRIPDWSDIYGTTYGGGFEWEIVNILYLQDQIDEARAIIEELKNLNEEELGLTEEQQKKKYEIIARYTEKIRQLHMAQARLALQSAESMFDSMTTIMEAWAGKTSDLYKAMFAMSKAFAIADATVKIYQGIAAAASLPFPANLAAMAQVAAATASIVQNIMAVRLAFEEREEGGPVEKGKAYIVGEAGPELFVPKTSGQIIPSDELKPTSVKVVVNNYAGVKTEVKEEEHAGERLIEIFLRRTEEELSSKIMEGRGMITKALERTYALNRAYGV